MGIIKNENVKEIFKQNYSHMHRQKRQQKINEKFK